MPKTEPTKPPKTQRKAAPSLVIAAFCTILGLGLGLSFQLRSPHPPLSSPSAAGPLPFGNEALSENEIIWAGLSGNPPRFIDSGDEKGMGYLEIQTKLIRKALVEAGFKVRNEYFSAARIAHEFSKKTPICFYPTEWKDPQATFATQPDRIYSIALDLKGEEVPSIVVLKENENKFQKFIDSKGILSIQALLKDSSLKTLLPKTQGLGPEFNPTFRSNSDGSIEITDPYKSHISTRVIRDNHQLIQMLNGGRFDYLLDTFIIQDDYKSIRSGKTPFKAIPYSNTAIRDYLDPKLVFVSVACGVHDTSMRAMPTINATVRSIRGPGWTEKNLLLQSQFDPGAWSDQLNSLAYRFAPEMGSGKIEYWYPNQMQYFPKLKKVVSFENSESAIATYSTQPGSTPPKSSLPLPHPKVRETEWQLFFLKKSTAWLLPANMALALKSHARSSFNIVTIWSGSAWRDALDGWSPEEIALLNEQTDRFPKGMSFSRAVTELLGTTSKLKSLTLIAPGISPAEISQIRPLLKAGSLTRLELVSVSPTALKEVFSDIPDSIEALNFSGSTLGDLRLSPLIQKLPHLRTLNVSHASIGPTDLEEALLNLGPGLVSLKASQQVLVWNPEAALKFGQKRFPKLEVLDLDYNALDDRHCDLFKAIPPSLRELRLNGNLLTSNCLRSLFAQSLPNMKTLELAFFRISVKDETLTKIPPSVTRLDLSYSLDSEVLSHLVLPPKLKSLVLDDSFFGMASFGKIAKHLDSELDELSLSNTTLSSPSAGAVETPLDFGIFKELRDAGVRQVKSLRLANLNLYSFSSAPSQSPTLQSQLMGELIRSLRVERVNLTNTRMTNKLLLEIASSWGSSLTSISLGQNLLSGKSISTLVKSSPSLRTIDLSRLPEVDIPSLAPLLSPRLTSLSLAEDGITDQDLEVLIPKLPKTLRSLDLSGGFFGAKGAELLVHYLVQLAPSLINLTLNTPLPEESWIQIFSSLPQPLLDFRFGPATLTEDSTSFFSKALPKSLIRLETNSVEFTMRHFGDFSAKLPPSLAELRLSGGTKFSYLPPPGTPHQRAKWPEALRLLVMFSSLDPISQNEIYQSVLPQNLITSSKASKITGESTAPMIAQFHYPRWLDLNGAIFDQALLRSLNQHQWNALTLNKLSPGNAKLADLSPHALQKLKLFSLTASSVPIPDILAILRKLPPHLLGLGLSSTRFQYSDVDELLRSLPPNLHELQLRGTQIGPKGAKKVLDYADQIQKKTGIKLRVRY